MRPDQRNTEPSATGRVALLLGAFSAGDHALGVSELARRTGLPKSSVHRLTEQLLTHGFLERTENGLLLGFKLFEIGQLAVRQRGLVDLARPHLADLRAASQNTVHLAVLEGTEVVYLDVLPWRDGPRLPSRIGGRFPAHATAVGKALLAYASSELVDAVLRPGLSRVSERTITSAAVFRKQLRRAREEGMAYEREESGAGVVCAASPILDHAGQAIAAISVSGWSNRVRLNHVAPAVRTTALALSRALR
ncbi:IclR family transcriptional regulator [Tamaricihabitans halophyticus]|uniref:IclR family transcriptional regulator n=1 Tax=Tamaricihabitans halophyticus TaxID=1262583 RepID=A0A4R2QW96_9PSEU|nr:IclR family transcriptional regulator [Tamaricihabitans halophyticus]TCP53534.1 IclR family transcriptional regulator [Tamaricihabitans halophyticus]